MSGKNPPLSAAEQAELLARVRQALGDRRTEDLLHMPLRQAMIEEYQRMGAASLQLLNMLGRYGFAQHLTGPDHARYQDIMNTLAESATRCTTLVGKSRRLDEDALLAGADAGCPVLN